MVPSVQSAGKRNSNVAIATSLILGKDSEVFKLNCLQHAVRVSLVVLALLDFYENCMCKHLDTFGSWRVLHDSHTVVLDVRTQGQQRKPPPLNRFDQETNQFRGPEANSVVDSAALGRHDLMTQGEASTAPNYLRFVESYHLHPRYILLVKKAAQNVRAPCGCQHVRY